MYTIIHKILIFAIVFLIGELIANYTWFKYLKQYFSKSVEAQEISEVNNKTENTSKFLLFNISTFKGVMERFVIATCLISNFPTIFIVFGTLKLGTRISDNRDIKNDYFLIGNLSSIIISVFYYKCFNYFLELSK